MNLIEQHIDAISEICRKHQVKELYAFGSVLDENRFRPDSDVDLLVEFNNMSYDFYAENYNEFENSLTSLLNREVDLLSPKFLRNRIFIKRLNETKKKIFES
ncbi:MAG: nucleotidyltransferase family protein [Bacteroidia bacterium]